VKSALLLLTTLMLGMPQAPVSDAAVGGRVKDLRPGASATAGLGTAALNRISLGTLVYRDGRRVFQMSTTVQLDTAGNYRISNVRPGEYYLRADSLLLQGFPIYYPGTLDIDAATKIAVEAGQELVGIDFDIASPPTFKVSGRIVNVPAAAAGNGLPNAILGITFVSADPRSPDPNAAPLLQNLRTQNNGEFEVNLPVGEWDLFPVIPMQTGGTATGTVTPFAPGTPTYATGRARVLLKDRNVENVVIRIGSSDINGRIVAPGLSSDDFVRLRAMKITLTPMDNYPSPLVSHVRAQQVLGNYGEFAFAAVPPGRYNFQLSSIPQEFYLSEMRVGSKSIYEDGVITVGTEPLDPVELVFGRGGGKVRLTINGTDAPGAAGSSSSRVVLMPDDSRRENRLLYKTVPGDFALLVIPGLAPGRYRVFAFQELPAGGAEQNAEYMMKYQKFGVSIDVAEGQTVDVQVPWIPSGK